MNHKLTWALGAIVLLGALAWTAAAPPAANALGNCSVDNASMDGEEQAFLGLINAFRAKSGAAPLSVDPALTRSAKWLAYDLASHSTFSHTDSLGRSPWVRMPDCGVSSPGGENLAAGTERSSAQSAMDAWVNSPVHRDDMLFPDFKSIGIGRAFVAGSQYGWYWVTDFGHGPGGSSGATTTAPAPAPAPQAAPAQAPQPAAAPTPAVEPPAPRTLGIEAGASLVMWEGGYVTPDEVFGPAGNAIAMVYVFDLGSEQWLRWGLDLDPKLRTLTEMREGVSYWVIATASVEVGME